MAEQRKGSRKFDKKGLKNNVDILTKWERDIAELLTQFNIETNLKKYFEIIEELLKKNDKETMDIVFIGKTSSGKSALINSLLGIEVMLSDIGKTTPSTVAIQTTSESKSYYKYSKCEEKHYTDFNDEEQLERFHDMVDLNSDDDSHTDQCIELYISESLLRQDCIISDKVAILDTPGLDGDVFGNEAVKRRILEADALIFVVDIVSWTNNKETRKLLNDKSFFVRPNVMVAVSKCDELCKQRKQRRDNMKKNMKKELSELMVFEGRTVEEMDTLISFISAKLILESNNHQMTTDDQDLLRKEFDNFQREIILTAQTNSRQKKDERIDDAIERCMNDLKQELDRIASEMTRVRANICKLVSDIQRSFNDVKDTTFVGTVDIERLYDRESGRGKVMTFLNHCKERGFNDIKKALIKEPVNPNLSDFFDRILREEIDQIVGLIDEESITQAFKLLDRPNFEKLAADEVQREFEDKVKEINEAFERACEKRKEELDWEFDKFVADIERKKEARNRKRDQIRRDNEKYMSRLKLGTSVLTGIASGAAAGGVGSVVAGVAEIASAEEAGLVITGAASALVSTYAAAAGVGSIATSAAAVGVAAIASDPDVRSEIGETVINAGTAGAITGLATAAVISTLGSDIILGAAMAAEIMNDLPLPDQKSMSSGPGLTEVEGSAMIATFVTAAAVFCLGPAGWLAASAGAALSAGVTCHSLYKTNSGRAELRKLEELNAESEENKLSHLQSNEEKHEDYKSEQEKIKKTDLRTVDEQKIKRQLEEESRMKIQYKDGHRATLTVIYKKMVTHVSTTVQMRLNNTARSLDYLNEENIEEGRDLKDAWQWVSNNIKNM